MNYVQPIEDINQLNLILNFFKINNIRNYLLFKTQLKLALRITDCLNLKVQNINFTNLTINLKEKKTNKQKTLKIDPNFANELKEYINIKKLFNDENILFFSREGVNQPLSRQQAHNILKNAVKFLKLNFDDPISTHSIRKTTAYHLYKKTKDIALVMYLLNHSSEQMTLRYLGITQTKLNNDLLNLFD